MRSFRPRIPLTVFSAVTAVLAVLAGARPAAADRPSAEPAAAAPTPLLHGHSHNDYLNSPPLTAALDDGYTSIEADVWLKSGTLWVCHDFATGSCKSDSGDTRQPLAFDSVYLQGLQTWIHDHGGTVYAGYTPPVRLLVEIKCAAPSTGGPCDDNGSTPSASSDNNPLNVLSAIDGALLPYQDLLSTPTDTSAPVQVVITGGHNGENYPNPAAGAGSSAPAQTSVSAVLHAQYPYNEAYLDGTLDSGYASADPVVPLLSFAAMQLSPDADCDFADYAPLTTPGSPTTKQLNEIVDAHANGHQVRVYGLPDCPAGHAGASGGEDLVSATRAWSDAARGSVDYIGSNHIDSLHNWLSANDSAPVGGGGDCGPRQTVKSGLLAQYCTLWADDVPVHAFADAGSATVGTLDSGGRANWFVGQTQGTTPQTDSTSWCYPGNPAWCNDWWAYTQADNGAWGWVSVVYFTGGSNDQPADDLYGCDVADATPAGPVCHPY
ncbi:PI-PLC domain-containing protein [Streptomyces sp. 7R007]